MSCYNISKCVCALSPLLHLFASLDQTNTMGIYAWLDCGLMFTGQPEICGHVILVWEYHI